MLEKTVSVGKVAEWSIARLQLADSSGLRPDLIYVRLGDGTRLLNQAGATIPAENWPQPDHTCEQDQDVLGFALRSSLGFWFRSEDWSGLGVSFGSEPSTAKLVLHTGEQYDYEDVCPPDLEQAFGRDRWVSDDV